MQEMSMNGFWTVCKRELKGYFVTPVAYVFLVIFLFFAGYLTFRSHFFEMRQADMRIFFSNMPLLFVFLVPCTAMRLWSEERKSGSIELLLTLPITVWQAVLGKFIAAWLFLGIALALTFPMPITVAYLGDPDGGLIITGYIGSFLMAGGYLAIGCFFSAMTKNQVISFILSVVACAVLLYAGVPSTLNALSAFLPMGIIAVIESLSFQTHFESILKGVLEFKDISYFLLLMGGFITACSIMLKERKAA
jgi:ABC-2 type transport system permease protein